MFDKTKVVIRPVNETISCELETKFKDVDDIITFDENQKLFLVKEILRGLRICLKNRSSRSDRLFFLIYFSDL